MEHSVAGVRACREKGSTDTRVGISTRVGIKANSSKNIFGLS